MNPIIVTIAVLCITIILLISEKVPLVAIGMLIPVVLTITGTIPAKQAFARLSDNSVILVIGVFVLGKAFFKVGLADSIGQSILRITGKFGNRESITLFLIMITAAAMSSVLSSLGVTIAMLSVVLPIADTIRISRTRAVLGLAYASTLGGMMTLIGTPLNLVGKAAYEAAYPAGSIGFLDLSLIGIPIGLLSIFFYCFIGIRYLPDRYQKPAEDAAGLKEQESASPVTERHRWSTVVIFLGFIVLVALDGNTPIPANIASVMAMLAIGFTGVLSTQEIFRSIKWEIILFVVGMLTLSDTMTNVGFNDLIADRVVNLLGATPSVRMLIFVLFFVTILLTQFMGNSAALGVVMPLGLSVALGLKIDPKPVAMAITIAASCAFATPMATQSYPMISGEGQLKFSDWVKQGLPILVICSVYSIVVIPLIWPV